MENSFTPDQSFAWHRLFETAPIPVLLDAHQSGILSAKSSHQGKDLLFSLLGRPPDEHRLLVGDQWWGDEMAARRGHEIVSFRPPRLASLIRAWSKGETLEEPELLKPMVQLCQLLLERGDVNPLARQNTAHPSAPPFQGPASSLELALAANLLPVVEQIHQWALEQGRTREFDEQIKALDAEGLAPIHRSIGAGRIHMTRFLLERGVDPNTPDEVGRSPVFHARNPEILDILIEENADLSAQWRSHSVIKHWAAAQKRSPYSGSWNALISKAVQASPEKRREATHEKAWIWFDERGVGSLRVHFLNGAAAAQSEWDQGWKLNMAPALGVLRPHEFRRKVSSGLMRGESTFLSEMGARWMKADGVSKVWFGLMESPHELFGDGPWQIRKGLEDWGVFALGAARHMRWRPTLTSSDPNRQMYVSDQEKLRSTMDQIATPQEWEDHMIKAAAVLQRPKNSSVWRDVAQCFSSYLDNLNDKEDRLRRDVVSQMDSRLTLIEKALNNGLRWPSAKLPSSMMRQSEKDSFPTSPFKLMEEYAQRVELSRSPQGSDMQRIKDRWMRVAFQMLTDTMEFSEFASDSDTQKNGIELRDFVSKSMVKMEELGASFPEDLSSSLGKRLDPFLPTLTSLAPRLFSGVQAAQLDSKLSQPSATRPARPRV